MNLFWVHPLPLSLLFEKIIISLLEGLVMGSWRERDNSPYSGQNVSVSLRSVVSTWQKLDLCIRFIRWRETHYKTRVLELLTSETKQGKESGVQGLCVVSGQLWSKPELTQVTISLSSNQTPWSVLAQAWLDLHFREKIIPGCHLEKESWRSKWEDRPEPNCSP